MHTSPMTAQTEDVAVYNLGATSNSPTEFTSQERDTINLALQILEGSMQRVEDVVLAMPSVVGMYCQLRLASLHREAFAVLFLTAHGKLIACEEMFYGTVTQVAVYPREVVRRALQLNAVGVILAHNHPSGSTTPSRADEALTATMKNALSLVDVRVHDHIIVTGSEWLSMAQRGLM